MTTWNSSLQSVTTVSSTVIVFYSRSFAPIRGCYFASIRGCVRTTALP
jgi:hypothetical protein